MQRVNDNYSPHRRVSRKSQNTHVEQVANIEQIADMFPTKVLILKTRNEVCVFQLFLITHVRKFDELLLVNFHFCDRHQAYSLNYGKISSRYRGVELIRDR